MTNFLKKIKLEVNDDLLHYAMAKSDTIPQLKVFRGQCKPTWLFMSGGEPVNVMHGANAPLLQKMIEKEIRKTRQVLKGEAFHDPIAFEDAVPSKSRVFFHENIAFFFQKKFFRGSATFIFLSRVFFRETASAGIFHHRNFYSY